MFLFTTLLITLIAITILALSGGAAFLMVFGDVIVCVGLVLLLVKLFSNKGKS